MSYLSEKRYINARDGRIKTNVLWNDADSLPQRHRTLKSFKASFGNVNHYEFEIAGCFIVVNIKYAFNHFTKNTYNDTRSHINGTLLATLNDPIMIIRDRYENQSTITFYKTFKTQNDLYHIVMFKAYKQENGKYYFKTIYNVDDNLQKVKKIIKALDRNTLYFKYTEGNGS
jgi:hypothetical protein